MDAPLLILRYSIYLSSNNLLSYDRTDKLLRWITSYEHFNVLEYLIKMRTPTTEIFGSNLLVSAARLEDTKTALQLIDQPWSRRKHSFGWD